MQELIKNYETLRARLKAYQYAMYVISWDSETEAPSGCFQERGKQLGVLSEESYKIATSDEYINIIDQLFEKRKKLKPVLAHEITEAKKAMRKMKKIPMEEYVKYSILLSNSQQIWAKAKNNQNFAEFAPILEQIVAFQRKYIAWQETDELKGYDILLDEYEVGFTTKEYDEFFHLLKRDLVPFVKKITSTKLNYNQEFKHYKYKKEKQVKFMDYIMKVMDYDLNRGLLKESEHPFTSGFGTSDVRITTHYYEDLLSSAIFSTIHELGHAKYEQQVDSKLDETNCSGGASMAMHESQSRFFENIVGRDYHFWETHYPKLQKLFKKELQNTSLKDWYLSINEAQNTFIRVEADELTYPIHIMIRYDIEKKLISGEIEVKDLPQIWNKAVKDYLGIDVPNDKQGVLQDVHWAMGSFGYFPTYALGSAYSAQILHAMKQDLDFNALIGKKNLKPINNWLKQRIHKFGSSKYPKDILFDATNEEFNPRYYITYLIDKYSEIYQIK